MLPPNQHPISHETLIKDHPALATISPDLLSKIIEVFSNPENGAPNKISKPGCLALAKKGKEAWNAWRAAFPVKQETLAPKNHANFSNHDFREKSINFSGFYFGDKANFQSAQFGDEANFQACQFGDAANFKCAEFGEKANFIQAKFGENTFFQTAQFGHRAGFQYTEFKGNSRFQGTQWGNWTKFEGADFGSGARFDGSQWGSGADFTHTTWGAKTYFNGFHWGQLREFYATKKKWQKAQKWAQANNLAPDEFQSVDFGTAKFNDLIDFSNRKFKAATNFGTNTTRIPKENRPQMHDGSIQIARATKTSPETPKEFKGERNFEIKGKIKCKVIWKIEISFNPTNNNIKFAQAPLFHGCEFHQDTSFDGAIFPKPTGNRDAARAYRTLKLAFNEQQATHEEQRFFKLEMQEEAKFVQWWKRPPYWAYGFFSDYGFSLWRPLLLWFLSIFIFAHVYPTSAHAFSYCWLCEPQCKGLTFNIFGQSLLQSLPFISLEKIPNTHPNGLTALGIAAHKTISFATFFLIGLALRNRFKIK